VTEVAMHIAMLVGMEVGTVSCVEQGFLSCKAAKQGG
jgi:hypothetical protein